jgi:DNA segregation ATPase FtsK/SpoIIIE, S-DNA-T family
MAERLNRIKEEVVGVASVLGSIYLAISLYSFSKWDPSLFTFTKAPVGNYGGVAGAYIADFAITIAGFSSFALPVFLLFYGIKRILAKEKHKTYLLGTILFVFFGAIMSSLLFSTFNNTIENDPGGILGYYIAGFLIKYFSLPGSYLFALTGFFTSIILLSPISLTSLILNRKKSVQTEIKEPEKSVIEDEILIQEPLPLPILVEPADEPDIPPASITPKRAASKTGYQLPSIDMLVSYDSSSVRPSKEELLTNSSLLESKLADFDVEGKIVQVHPGPIVTMYEFEPAPGVKINRVVSLSDDLALSLKAQSIRVSPLQGTSAIGIEVPNKLREVVSLREMVSSENYDKSNSRLTLALGKDISGKPVVADLAKMPHLLVAGATGAGKSVSINSMVMSILYKATPKEVKMLMIDPKLLELSTYEGIPHLISPVITSPKNAADSLRKMVFEMERRYRLLAEKGARNIEGFNKQSNEEDRLPYIVIFIDELADLMFASANEVEDSIARLAQMARAAGIHLIIATQRPSVDVITGIIKANFPARISFQVFSKIDSRTILDMQGAEQLLGKGDMLMMLPGSKTIRVHGALITEDEIKSVTEFIKSQGSPDYSIFEKIQIEEPKSDATEDDKDETYYKALEFAESVGEVSISSLQRRLKIGYNKSARIMEIMEKDGLVGPQKGAGKPREYLGKYR